jgi:acetyl-CoA/propionyl-CoA carboxylase biotin carboxyl carrier protein
MAEINKVLIANRGEIAVRIIQTLKRMNIASVVIYHATDVDSIAVQQADEAIEIFGETPVAAYINQDSIISACLRSGADAIHPGFGFVSENAEFVRRVDAEGIAFIGPKAETIDLMGNKVGARTFCIEHNHPIAPSVTDECGMAQFIEQAKQIGTPLLIKAAAGGGGKGMHIVRDESEIETAIKLASTEALRSFGDSQVYAERYIDTPRHIEVQVLADHHGHVIHLGERECSIQRRFQKVVEEAPSPTIDAELRQRICDTAVEIAVTAGYRNAGTVEFIMEPSGEFYFLEMNTRIQVEHPITEAITGVDIVEQQIRVARGEPLSLIQSGVKFNGHAIEVRLYAEDADNDFAPATGPLLLYRPAPGIRFDNGFNEGQAVTSAFDPMLAKIVVHADSREAAIKKAVKACEQTLVMGVTTNTDFLERILTHPAFIDGKTHTGFIDEHKAALMSPALTADQMQVLLTAAALSNRAFNDPELAAPELHANIGSWRN